MPAGSDPWTEEVRLLVGDRLRRTRLQQGLSIRKIAELSNLSKTSIVQVEAGKTSRRSTYLKMAESMGLHLERLMLPNATGEKPYIAHQAKDDSWFDLVHFGDGPLPEDAQNSADERRQLAIKSGIAPLNILACRLESGRIKPTILELYTPSPARSHAGEEHVFVLSGQAVVSVGDSQIPLNEGESITFWSSEPHSYAPQEGSALPVRLLSVRVDS